jgi:20S proteasome subunit alpha 6
VAETSRELQDFKKKYGTATHCFVAHLANGRTSRLKAAMFRNHYDGDTTTWSPQGRIHQIEYAMEAVTQGSAVVGIKSRKHVVIATVKRSAGELGSYQQKLFKIDDHLAIGMSGLSADARVLCKYMRSECLNHKFVYASPIQVGRLVLQVADKSQVHTQRYGRRPYGVGLLVAGYDQTGAHLYETCPSGNYFDYRAQAIGGRFQSAKTYLERRLASFEGSSLDELIRHSLFALRETLASGAPGTEKDAETKLTPQNVSIAVLGEGTPFALLEGAALQPYLDRLDTPVAAPAAMEH